MNNKWECRKDLIFYNIEFSMDNRIRIIFDIIYLEKISSYTWRNISNLVWTNYPQRLIHAN